MRLENVFSWSKSRDEQFRECQRKYYYDKYVSWGGWDTHAPKEARLAYILKNLKNRWAWKGETVHHVIENTLKSVRGGKLPSWQEIEKDLTDTMRRDFRSSKSKKYLEEPKKSMGLFEHEYAKPVSDDIWKKIHDESVTCLKNFYESSFYQELLGDDKSSWLVIEDLEEYNFDGAKIYVKLDFARRKNGVVEIYDWKTGKNGSEDASVQIGTYVIFAMQKWNVGLEDVKAFIFSLSGPDPKPDPKTVSQTLIDSTKEIMKASILEMQKLLSDPAKNVPLERENFKFTENARLCDFCNFYKICEKYNPKIL